MHLNFKALIRGESAMQAVQTETRLITSAGSSHKRLRFQDPPCEPEARWETRRQERGGALEADLPSKPGPFYQAGRESLLREPGGGRATCAEPLDVQSAPSLAPGL